MALDLFMQGPMTEAEANDLVKNIVCQVGAYRLQNRSSPASSTCRFICQLQKNGLDSRIFISRKCGNKMYFYKEVFQKMVVNWFESDYVIIDTETTGLRKDDEIIEISIINMRGETLFDSLIKPTRPIPAEAMAINHITDEMVAQAPAWPEVYQLVMQIIAGRRWLAWNSRFDARLMTQTSLITGVYNDYQPAQVIEAYQVVHDSQIDAKQIYSQWYGDFDAERSNFTRQSLSAAVKQQNVQINGSAHRALADCFMVLSVLESVSSNEKRKLPDVDSEYGAKEKIDA